MICYITNDLVCHQWHSTLPKIFSVSQMHQFFSFASKVICYIIDNLPHFRWFATSPWPIINKILASQNSLHLHNSMHSEMHNFSNFAIKGDMLDQWWLTTLQAICCITSGDMVQYLKFSASPKCTNFSIFIHAFRFLSQR